MRGKAIIPLVLGLVIGVVTVKLLVDTIREARAAGGPSTTITLVQAANDISAFDEITPEMVKTLETVESALVPESERFENMEDVIGRVAGKSIPKGAPILASMLAPEGTPSGLTGRIPPGFRAVSVRIDEVTGVAFQLRPGNWVDVFVVMDVDSPSTGKRDTIAEVILRRIMVVAVGYSSDAGRQPGRTNVKPAKSATLLVEEQDVPKLHLAATRGRITLAMRGADDLESTGSGRARLSDLTDRQKPQTQVADGANSTGWLDTLKDLISAETPKDTRPVRAKVPAPANAFHSVLVVHGDAGGQGGSKVERITFESKDSQRIISVGTTRVSGKGGGGWSAGSGG